MFGWRSLLRRNVVLKSTTDVPLSWFRRDIEQRLGFRGGRYTQVNSILAFLLGIIATVLFYAALMPLQDTYFATMFTQRGPTPYFIALFTSWSLFILLLKSCKLALQRKALEYHVVPENHDFVLSPATVDQVMHKLSSTADDPRHFVLFNRIAIALSNLQNLGRVADVDDILRSQASQEEASMETSYSLVAGFVWAIPVLGFIGTVLGLSDAIGGFSSVLTAANDMHEISAALRGVTAGLSTAFETTLEGLVAALVIQLLLTFVKKSEEEFLDGCAEYCTRNIVSRLRIIPFEQEVE